MPLVRIIKSWTSPDLMRQTPLHSGQWGDCRFTLEPVARCDYLVILNHVPTALRIVVPPENVWCFVQEPAEPEFRWIRKGYPYYARIYLQDESFCGPRFIHHQGALPWHVGRNYDQLLTDPLPPKRHNLSWITSNLARHPGHRDRLEFLKRLRNEVPFDLYGRGFAPISDKWEGLAPYRYSIAVENRQAPHYWTEKVADCFLTGTMPLYFGAENLSDYFPSDSFVWIDIKDAAAPRQIAEIIRSNLAERHFDAILEARRRVLDQHQLFPLVANLIAAAEKSIPAPGAREVEIPALPDMAVYYRRNGLIKRFLKSIGRRAQLALGG